ncbi:lipopolysaccharide heptosyltransferase I [Gilvimarinus sp. SDUM040013]|uniref:Lipopolysaccharide heptosyltransferase 1 n=1 Tax=Gilvimarinus gilvus TaxID=3058038 RepID=A0ABU4RZ36_9GAMM|nr:lipopolysaccharide heptosyltransferase I [Gilvimarinus sp. SDUM040013]MDO3384548.1 lipopolysaccharide heptosyltransferase I [Gilvimarinus sp. SDUM040013]MDX6850117.1 lipopolysaccharide heptosyltransferase I [Gilvimarinus sp. SDUM040013]
MKVLIVKLSSMGDLVQTLPAVSDAVRAIPGIRFDWAVDEAFAEVPTWHPAVERTIVSAHRRWKKSPKSAWKSGELKAYWQELRRTEYDLVLDAQTNFKSASVTRMARGLRAGPDADSVRERGAHWFYQRRFAVAQDILAVDRWRDLFAAGLGYQRPSIAPEFGLAEQSWPAQTVTQNPYIVAVTNASWPTKCLPNTSWQGLIDLAAAQGLDVLLPWGSPAEREAANAIAKGRDNAKVLERMSLTQLAGLLHASRGAVCNDTGLAHIAAALGKPTVTAYGPTDPALIGATGPRSVHIVAPGYICDMCGKRLCRHPDNSATVNAGQAKRPRTLEVISGEQLWQAFVNL